VAQRDAVAIIERVHRQVLRHGPRRRPRLNLRCLAGATGLVGVVGCMPKQRISRHRSRSQPIHQPLGLGNRQVQALLVLQEPVGWRRQLAPQPRACLEPVPVVISVNPESRGTADARGGLPDRSVELPNLPRPQAAPVQRAGHRSQGDARPQSDDALPRTQVSQPVDQRDLGIAQSTLEWRAARLDGDPLEYPRYEQEVAQAGLRRGDAGSDLVSERVADDAETERVERSGFLEGRQQSRHLLLRCRIAVEPGNLCQHAHRCSLVPAPPEAVGDMLTSGEPMAALPTVCKPCPASPP